MDGKILKALRTDANLTQEELGKKINVSESAIRMIKLGKRKSSDDVEEKIANYFKVSLDYINGRKNTNLIDDFIDLLIRDKIITSPNSLKDKEIDRMIESVNNFVYSQ